MMRRTVLRLAGVPLLLASMAGAAALTAMMLGFYVLR